MKNASITKAKREDAPLILEFINGLAKYERMKKYVKATVVDIEKNIFDDKRAEVIFVKLGKQAVGFAVYFYSFSTFLSRPTLHLEDFFIIDKERGKGYGKLVLKHLANTALENDCLRFEWSCLEWNTPATRFYEKLGAKPLHGWIAYRMDDEELINFAKEE